MSVADLREIQCHFFQNFLKFIQIELVSKEGGIGIGAGHIFGDLLEAGMELMHVLEPRLFGRDLKVMGNA